MKTTLCGIGAIVLTATISLAQYSSYDRELNNARWEADYQRQQVIETRRQAESDARAAQWEADTQRRYAEEEAARARRDAENARWQAEQQRNNSSYRW